jgi:hypothetical protein
VLTETKTITFTPSPITSIVETITFTEPDGHSKVETVTVTPTFEIESYTIDVTPSWTSVP